MIAAPELQGVQGKGTGVTGVSMITVLLRGMTSQILAIALLRAPLPRGEYTHRIATFLALSNV
jgi:hypothetical protein